MNMMIFFYDADNITDYDDLSKAGSVARQDQHNIYP